MITCAEFEEFVIDYFDDRLSAAQKKVFERHLKLCPECRDYLKAYKCVVELGKAVFQRPQDLVPAEVPEDLITAILAARSTVRDDLNGKNPNSSTA